MHLYFFFFFNDTATTEIYTLSLHDALPIWTVRAAGRDPAAPPALRLLRTRRCPADLGPLHAMGSGGRHTGRRPGPRALARRHPGPAGLPRPPTDPRRGGRTVPDAHPGGGGDAADRLRGAGDRHHPADVRWGPGP